MKEAPVALVTGGSRGIGRAICVALAKLGHRVVVNFRENLAAAEQTLEMCEAAGSPAVELCQGDIRSRSHRDLVVDFVQEQFGRIDILVNNAGIAPAERYDILITPEKSLDDVMDANLKAPFMLTQRVAGRMIEMRNEGRIDWGAIINISSIRSYTAAQDYAEYCLSKAGVSMMTQLFAIRLAKHGIEVHEVCPGLIETDMTTSPAVRELYNRKLSAGLTPINRWGKPEEVARCVTAIARRDFPFSTGQVFNVDGGWHLRHL